MKNRLFKKCLTATLGVLALGSTASWAESDTFYLGKGTRPLEVSGSHSIKINSYARVKNVPADRTSIEVDSIVCPNAPCFSKGDLVMVLQMTGENLSDQRVGSWELVRLKEDPATGGAAGHVNLKLAAPLRHAYTAKTQVIRVPEYTDVTVGPGATLTAKAWDGKTNTGGVLAFLANGEVTNKGTITVLGAGFKGGDYVRDTSKTSCENTQKATSGVGWGEGIASDAAANGGKAGVCGRAGGGGGGNGGAGGRGGNQSSDGKVSDDKAEGLKQGGAGGGNLIHATLAPNGFDENAPLTMGGGGGAGHGTKDKGGAGGAGGGIIFIRAGELLNAGTFTADANAGSSTTETDGGGGGGGGAGGSIYVRVTQNITCESHTLSANGGTGGSVSPAKYVGPGGGGGGGRIMLQALSVTCDTSYIAATAGSQADSQAKPDVHYGAKEGDKGTSGIDASSSYVPPPPTVKTPSNDSLTNNARPLITGTAVPLAKVHVSVDGIDLGSVDSNEEGIWTLTPPRDLQDESHKVKAVTKYETQVKTGYQKTGLLQVSSASSNTNTFTVDTTPPVTTITAHPSGPTLERDATLAFNANESNVTYECRLDGKTYEQCTSPMSYTGLTDGEHTFEVFATDAATNQEKPQARRIWTVVTPTNPSEENSFLGGGVTSCSATGGDASLVLMGLGTFLTLARRRRRGSSST